MDVYDYSRYLIVKHEAKRKKPYLCTANKTTIGIGRNLDDKGLSDNEIELLFLNDYKDAVKTCSILFSNFSTIDLKRQAALIDMAFNLGHTRFRKFKKLINAVEYYKWSEAAIEAKDSDWYHQVGERGVRIVSILETGTIPID